MLKFSGRSIIPVVVLLKRSKSEIFYGTIFSSNTSISVSPAGETNKGASNFKVKSIFVFYISSTTTSEIYF